MRIININIFKKHTKNRFLIFRLKHELNINNKKKHKKRREKNKMNKINNTNNSFRFFFLLLIFCVSSPLLLPASSTL